MLKIIVAFVVLLIHKILHRWKGYNYCIYTNKPLEGSCICGYDRVFTLTIGLQVYFWEERPTRIDPLYHWLSHYGWHKQNVVAHVTMSWAYVATIIVILSRHFVYTHTHMPVATYRQA